MNKEQIIDEAYKNYWDTYPNAEKTFQYEGSTFETRRMSNDEFIDRCKTDPEFSERWGLKIEERELSLEEELEYMMGKVFSEEALTHQVNTPTKLITITYKDTIIESYE